MSDPAVAAVQQLFVRHQSAVRAFALALTGDYCYKILQKPVHVHDLNATLLHLLGIDHERLTYRFQGRDYRLTDVHGKVVKDLIA